MVYAVRPHSKTPLQIAYFTLGSTEPVTVKTVGAQTIELTKQFDVDSFPSKVICGNSQLTLINDEHVSEDLLHAISLKLNSWKLL